MIDLVAARFPEIAKIITYEDMVADPAASLRTAAALCDLSLGNGTIPAVANDIGCGVPYKSLMDKA
jgi:hypothetical protein